MKKLFLIFVLFLSIATFAQKTVYVFNFSSYNVQIGEIQTKPATASHPRFKTNNPGVGGFINVPAGTTYTLENPNNTFFPFYSPTSVPYVNAWRRQFTAGATWNNFLSTNLNNVLAIPQVFYYIKFGVGSNGSLGGGTIGLWPTPTISGTGWDAYYEPIPGTNLTTITIIDN